jgi:hypothetical protein
MMTALTLTLADGEARTCEPCTFGPDLPGHVCPFCEYPFAGDSCPNPACLAGMTADRLAQHRQQVADREARDAQRAALDAWTATRAAERREAEQAAYNQAHAQARAAGQCLTCLARSMRGGGQPRFTRHRDAANCPEARRHGGAS